METWRTIPAFEGLYEISDHGRVRSLARRETVVSPRARTFVRSRAGRIIRQSTDKAGYKRVHLYNGAVDKHALVHCLVADAFIGSRPDGLLVCHNDGDKGHNRPNNLRHDTPKNNSADMERHGTRLIGEDHPNVKLTDAAVSEIRRTPRAYGANKQLAKRFGVTAGYIAHVRCGTFRRVTVG